MFVFSLQLARATQTEWIPATTGLAADHLLALLRDAAVRRSASCSTKQELHKQLQDAIADVHAEYFEEYRLWHRQLELGELPLVSGIRADSVQAPTAPLQLLELALWFLIYTEAANLRHTPHLLFLIFYIMRSSKPFLLALESLLLQQRPSTNGLEGSERGTYHHTHWCYWLSQPADSFPDKPSGYDLTSLRRNLLQQLYFACPAALHYPDPSAPLPEHLTAEDMLKTHQQQDAALDDAVVGILTVTAPKHRSLVDDALQQLRRALQHGSQQVFLNWVVQPIFFFLAEQIDLAGQQGQEEAALRIAYCDVDEACCSPSRINHLLRQLQDLISKLPDGSKDRWHALRKASQLRGSGDAAVESYGALRKACQLRGSGDAPAMMPPEGWALAMQRATQQQEQGARRRWKGTAAVQGQDRYPRDLQRVKVLNNLALLMQRNRDPRQQDEVEEQQQLALRHVTAKFYPGLTLESESLAAVYARAKYGSGFWADHLFSSKTFVEARSMAAPFVAFWRVYSFHAVLFTIMAAVAFAWKLTGSGAAGWTQLLAALCLGTVTDGLMRAGLAAARLLLLTYNMPEGGRNIQYTINPFPPGSWRRALVQLVLLLMWPCWTVMLALAVVPVLVDAELPFARGLSNVLRTRQLWLLFPILHISVFWGTAVLSQRPGYATSWQSVYAALHSAVFRKSASKEGVTERAKRLAHADCSADPDVDALFYPSRNLTVDRTRFAVNALVWLLVIALKVLFEFGLVLLPLATVVIEVINGNSNILGDAFEASEQINKDNTFKASHAIIVIVVAVPIMLVSLCDTGLIYSLVGALFSAAVGFRRGVGSVRRWPQLVSNFNVLIDNYKHHCVSRAALFLHLKGDHDLDKQQRDLLSNKELACLLFEQLQLDSDQLNFISNNKDLGLTTVLPARCFIAGAVPELVAGVPGSEQELWTVATVAEAWRDLRSCMGRLTKHLAAEVRQLSTATTRGKRRSAVGKLLRGGAGGGSTVTDPELHAIEKAVSSLTARWAPTDAEETGYRPQLRKPSTTELRQRDRALDMLYAAGQASPAIAQVAGWLCDALTLLQDDTRPSDDEAVRFILSFAASLNDPGLKVAPALQVMPSMTTLTPHYDEDVVYALNAEDALADLQASRLVNMRPGKMDGHAKMVYLINAEGCPTPTMAYLRSVYGGAATGQHQWANFVERIKGLARQKGLNVSKLPSQVTEYHFLPDEPLHTLKEELLMWASWRGQLLARTARGMMSYRTALAAIAEFENPLPSSASTQAAGLTPEQAALARQTMISDLLDCKYNYVISSQNFGEFSSKTESDLKAAWLVHSIGRLRHRHPTLKVAFIDKRRLVTAARLGHQVEVRRDCSVMLSSVQQQQLVEATGMTLRSATLELPAAGQQEAYRVQLPINFESARGVILGEGKPENQNHAIIFCHGEALQTIDCNQDNLVAEGLKLRNLLAEFLPQGWDQPQPQFTNFADRFRSSLTSLAGPTRAESATGAMFSNERLLEEFRKGKGRVALVGFREWIFSEDSGALAEFAAATERSFGTTVQRLMHFPGACRFHYGHPDVWRRSFISTCGGVSKSNKGLHVSEDVFGGYNVMLRGRDITYVDYISVGKGRDMGFETINTFEAKVAAGNGEQVLSREIRRLGQSMDFARLLSWYHTGNGFFINTALTMLTVHVSLWVLLLLAFGELTSATIQNWLWSVQVLQLGSLSVVVYWVTLVLEAGLFNSVWTILRQILQGSLMFYIFRAQTSAFSFTQDLLFGGAKYLATGRGYKLQPTSYKDLFRRFGRSHMYFGAVLLQYSIAVITAGHLTDLRIFVLWAPTLVVVSLLFGPFWFTPFAFRTTVVMDDMAETQAWFTSPSLKDSWQAWNKEWVDVVSNASGKQMGRLATCIRAHLVKLPMVLLLIGAVYRFDVRQGMPVQKFAVMLAVSAGVVLMVAAMQISRSYAARKAMKHQAPRLVDMVATIALVGGLLVTGLATSGNVFEFGNVLLVLFGTTLLLRVLPLVYYNPVLLRVGFASITNMVYQGADAALALLLNAVRFLLSLFDLLTGLQAQLLFNTAYAQQVMADTSVEHSELPRIVAQAQKLKRQQQTRM
eukprot:gene8714-8895_t